MDEGLERRIEEAEIGELDIGLSRKPKIYSHAKLRPIIDAVLNEELAPEELINGRKFINFGERIWKCPELGEGYWVGMNGRHFVGLSSDRDIEAIADWFVDHRPKIIGSDLPLDKGASRPEGYRREISVIPNPYWPGQVNPVYGLVDLASLDKQAQRDIIIDLFRDLREGRFEREPEHAFHVYGIEAQDGWRLHPQAVPKFREDLLGNFTVKLFHAGPSQNGVTYALMLDLMDYCTARGIPAMVELPGGLGCWISNEDTIGYGK